MEADSRDSQLTELVRDYCNNVGADVVGFTDPTLCEQYSPYSQPENFLPGTLTIILLGLHLYDIILDACTQPPENSRGYQYADQILERMCHQVETFLISKNFEALVVPYRELYLKDIGALGGVGPIGKNNLLLQEQYGPQVRYRALVTTAPLECGSPIFESAYCQECTLCIENCPAAALTHGKYNVQKCERYQLAHLQKLSVHTAIWCNECINACPVGQKKVAK